MTNHTFNGFHTLSRFFSSRYTPYFFSVRGIGHKYFETNKYLRKGGAMGDSAAEKVS